MIRIEKITIITVVALIASISLKAQTSLLLSQEECRQRALTYSEDIKKSENKLSQAEIDKKLTATAFLPTVEKRFLFYIEN